MQVGHDLRRIGSVHDRAIGMHDRGHVERALVAALDFEGIDAGSGQVVQVLDHAQIVGVHHVCAANVLLNGVIRTRALFLNQRVAPAARLRAEALIARAARHGGGKQAAARIRHAHGTVDEGLELKLARNGGTQIGDILHRHLARKHHARGAQVIPGARGGRVHHRSLRAHVALHMRRVLAGQGKRAHVADDQRIGARTIERFQVFGQLAQIALAHHRVHGHVHLHACVVRERNRARDVFEREILGALAHAEAVARQVNGIGAETDGRLKLRAAARGRQKFDLG